MPKLISALTAALFVVCCSLFGGGCAQTHLAHHAIQFIPSPALQPNLPRIEGLRARMAGLDGPDGQLRVLIVNGMATDSHGYAFTTQRNLAARLDQPACVQDRMVQLERPTFQFGERMENAQELEGATVRITSWAANENATPRLVFYELLWTPYSDEVTDRFLARYETDVRFFSNPVWTTCADAPKRIDRKDRRVAGRERPPRAFLNALVKDEVMVAGLTDAVLSVGPLGAAARDSIRQALCLVAADALEVPQREGSDIRCRLTPETLARYGGPADIARHLAHHEFAILTYSLGSFLTIDAIDEFRLWPDDLGDPQLTCPLMPGLFNDTPIYMFSNQVSLLLTAHPQFGCIPGRDCLLYGQIGNRRVLLPDPRGRGPLLAEAESEARYCREPGRLQLIAFNDPNDIMGYRLPDFLADTPIVASVANIRVRNPALRIPGLIANPAAAHTNHGANPAILDVMVDGRALSR